MVTSVFIVVFLVCSLSFIIRSVVYVRVNIRIGVIYREKMSLKFNIACRNFENFFFRYFINLTGVTEHSMKHGV